ncbi:LOW QUALITY PROTEIN: uncharacterized protein LOC129586131 [Paramacrobiotus metropolitanus]|uniref:LOW QUALITY PROTEIN: uncharacterized protein LOC129586131 n=1 Tax=Paramacrobiotus metropolitanus TaxID=2943436 RepID=UPI002445E63A|nr:LOW QUALITY PROTEIN: uncharacterized protein LOC129586131 [Paramacrobiotus metropolitanus]
MSIVKIPTIPDSDFGKRSVLQPLGPSVPGGSFQMQTSAAADTLKVKTLSDDSYESSSSPEDKTVLEKVWEKNPLALLKRHIKPLITAADQPPASSTGNVSTGVTVDVRVKKERSDHDADHEAQPASGSSLMVLSKHGIRRKHKRHRSLDAKTARYYAKRQQATWTGLGSFRGRAMSSSSDEENGGKKIRERSPRRKKGAKGSDSVSSKTPSRDPSATPLPRPAPRGPEDLPLPQMEFHRNRPLLSRTQWPHVIIQPSLTIPAIEITTPDISVSVDDQLQFSQSMTDLNKAAKETNTKSRTSLDSVNVRQTENLQTIEEWLHSRKSIPETPKLKSSVSMQLFPLPPAPVSLSKNSTACEQSVNAPRYAHYASVSALPWNHPTNRHSLSAFDESVLGSRKEPMSPDSVKNMRQFFEHLHSDSPVDAAGVAKSAGKMTITDGKYSHDRAPVVHAEKTPDHPPVTKSPLPPAMHHGRLGIVMQSTERSELLPLFSGNVTADSQFLHNALQISNNASRLLNDLRSSPSLQDATLTPEPQLVLQVSDGRNTTRWSSDWQINRSSNSGAYSKPSNLTRPSSISAFDQHRLTVPGRPNPLREINHHELERALEELDEFYESLSAKSEDVTIIAEPETVMRSTLDGGRSFDSGLSSLQGRGENPYLISKNEPDRLEYTKQWLQDEKHVAPRRRSHNPQTHAMATITMAPPPVPYWSPPTDNERHIVGERRRFTGHPRDMRDDRGNDRDNRKSGRGQKDDYARRKLTNSKTNSKSLSDLPNPSYLLMSVVYTPTVFTGPALEFQKYPGSQKPQPHIEMDDLSTRKIIHSQNTPLFKVTADLSKQLPSSRNDYATPHLKAVINEKKSREPDTVRDDAAFRQLRSDRKNVTERPQTLVVKPNFVQEKAGGGFGGKRMVSDSIRQLAKQFEGSPNKDSKGEIKPFFRRFTGKSQSSPNPDAVHAAMQIDGKRVTLKSPNAANPHVIRRSNSVKQESPKISPISELDMEKLLLSLSAISSNSTPTVASNMQLAGDSNLSMQTASTGASPWARLTGRKKVFPTASQSGISV